MKFNNKIILIAIVSLVLSGGIAFAQQQQGLQYNLLVPLPAVGGAPGETQSNGLSDYLANAIPFIIAFAAVLAVVQITVGGFEYALSEAITNKSDAKDRMTQAIVGLLLALTSYLILFTINPDLVKLQLPIPKLSEVGGVNNSGGVADAFHYGCLANACTSIRGAGTNDCSACGGQGPGQQAAADTCSLGKTYCKNSQICFNQCVTEDFCLSHGQLLGVIKPSASECPQFGPVPNP